MEPRHKLIYTLPLINLCIQKMKTRNFLLPGSFRFAGFLFLIAGTILGIARFYFGVKPDVLTFKIFAFYSSYIESKYLQFIRNNMSEEIVGVLLLMGLFFIAFARDKVENELKDSLRNKAFYITAYLQLIFLVLSLLFTYGFAFVYMLMVNMMLPLAVFITIYRILLLNEKYKKKRSGNIIPNAER
jgi:hypothetical protein